MKSCPLLTGKPPKFPLAERHYLVQAIRYVSGVEQVSILPYDPDVLPAIAGLQTDIWAVTGADDTPQKRASCATHRIAESRLLGR